MSNFLIFKAAFNNSATPIIGTYTAEGATARFNRNTDISPDYYLYNTADGTAVQWFVPTAETTDFEFVADILTRQWTNRVTYFIIADSTGTTRLRMWSQYDGWYFENSDSTSTTGSSEFIGGISPTTSGGFGVFHQFRVRVRKLTASSSSVEVYVDGTLKLTATTGAALITCAKIGFVGGVSTWGPGTGAGIKNAYVYDLSDGDVVDRGVLSGAFNRFISWMKSKFALKSDIPTVNNGTLTIQKNGTNVATFTANQSTNATANITVPTKTSDLTNDSGFITSDDTKIPLAGSNAISGDLIPSTDGTVNLGGSSYQWNNLYAKNYYYNGVAWGLDKANVWTAHQKVAGNNSRGTVSIYNPAYTKGSASSSTELPLGTIFMGNGGQEGPGNSLGFISTDLASSGAITQLSLSAIENTASSSARTNVVLLYDKNDAENPRKVIIQGTVMPHLSAPFSLGTSTNKWKTLNGINPGALSLPGINYISLDTTNFDVTATNIGTFTPTVDGWAILSMSQKNKPFGIWLLWGSYRATFYSVCHQGDYMIFALIPVWTNLNMTVYCTADDIDSTRKVDWLRLFPCQGNV